MLPNRTSVWTLAFIILASGTSVADETPGWQTDFLAAREQARQLNRPLLLHFSASYCGPCRKMAATTMKDSAVINALSTRVVGVKIDVQNSPELANRFGVQSIPADIFIDPQSGSRIIEASGYQSSQQYVAVVSRAADRYRHTLAAAQLAEQSKSRPVDATTASQVNRSPAPEPRLALDGYSPVSLWRDRKWEKGNPELTTVYRGQRFFLTTTQQLEQFNTNARKYAPRLLSCDPVVLWDTNRAVLGSTQFGAFYDDELFLFSSAENRTRFKSDPERFTRTRVVLNVDQIEDSVVR